MPRTLKIQPVLNGWVVHVGCQSVLFTELERMASEIRRYYLNPSEVEADYLVHAVNKVMETSLAVAAESPVPPPPQREPAQASP